MVAEIAPAIPSSRIYSFAVPESMEDSLVMGLRVLVPMGRRGRLVQGFVVGLDRRIWDDTLRPIDSLVDDVSYLTPDLIELGREIARHYVCPLARTLKAMTPEAVRRQRGLTTVRYAQLVRTPDEIREVARRITAKRRAVIEMLAASGQPIPVDRLLDETGASRATLRAMAANGWIEVHARKELRQDSPRPRAIQDPAFELNDEQREALDAVHAAIEADEFSVTLLFGVSGSGKTEIYIRAMQRVVASGRQAILLVPEIVLTTQLVQRLASRFENVAISHSGLTEAQRSVIWRQVAAGDRKVVIGTRSAVFAPCPSLGLVCVDEEQETGYKNLQAPRFNVRDAAIMRAKLLGIPIVLGSATPLVETWYNSEHRADYRRVVIRHRVKELPMPKVYVADMRDEYAEQKKVVVLSRLMDRLLAETLRRGEQALLLINRRGFARRIYCPACRTSLTCPNCNVSLVVHSVTGRSICHYCRSHVPTPTVCPNLTCGETLVQAGLGTQQVEEILADRFPDARIQRVDSDTMRHRSQYQQVVEDFEARKVDILVGTQMIAKGLDFPFVSFVGVVHADAGGMAADFRAHERLFQLITQVAGRAGRADATGRVVVQTTTPELPALKYALQHDYESFAAAELRDRRRVGLPPFRRLARIVLAHARDETARREAEALWGRIREAITSLALEHADVLGPNPCVLSRLRGKYRYDLLVRTLNASALRELLHHLDESGGLRTKAESTIIDVDPVALA
jgi:primosomal protein N' (replication factor Y)